MTTTTTPRTAVSRHPWWARLSERCYRATTPRLVQCMQLEAAGTCGVILEDLKTPLDAHFEREMARQLDSSRLLGFKPARSLMPVMLQRFGLENAELATDPDYAAMRATCNACPVVGQCWKAMRAAADVEECRGFCPNAEAFERRATQ